MIDWAIDRYLAALAPLRWWIALGVAAAVIAQLPAVRRAAARVPHLGAVVTALVCALAVWSAWRILWISDDAFISLHYARNWIEGHGLVFNAGERVEGYTNFLWLAILAALGRLGADLPTTAVVLGLASHVAAIVATGRVVRRLAPGGDVRISLASIAVALSYPMVSFATGGLETMFCAALVLLAAWAAHAGRCLTAGTLGVLATMGHPDHALFYVTIGAVLLAHRLGSLRGGGGGGGGGERFWSRPAVRELARYALPFFAIYVPYFCARWAYYGDPLPNTFYAKSGAGSYFGQGVKYLIASITTAGVPLLVPAFVLGAWAARRQVFGQLAVIGLALYLGYVARIGGDYMTGRLLVVALPLIFVLAELGVRHLRRVPLRMLVAAPWVLACLPTPLHRPLEEAHYMTDERTYYVVKTLRPLALRGGTPERVERLHEAFGPAIDRGYHPAYAAWAIGYVAWRTRFRVIDMHGLTDPVLARMPLTRRGRPGHEREATAAYVLSRGADVSGKHLYPAPYTALAQVTFRGQRFHLARYRPALIDGLRGQRGASFLDFPAYLDQYLAAAAAMPPARRAADLEFFERYYFSVNDDPARRERLQRLAAPAPSAPAPPAPAPPAPAPPAPGLPRE